MTDEKSVFINEEFCGFGMPSIYFTVFVPLPLSSRGTKTFMSSGYRTHKLMVLKKRIPISPPPPLFPVAFGVYVFPVNNTYTHGMILNFSFSVLN